MLEVLTEVLGDTLMMLGVGATWLKLKLVEVDILLRLCLLFVI
jgi:hypothetical protein